MKTRVLVLCLFAAASVSAFAQQQQATSADPARTEAAAPAAQANPASANESNAPAQPAAGKSIADSQKVTCKRRPAMGSRVGKNICHTKEEWIAMEQGARAFMRDMSANPRRSDAERMDELVPKADSVFERP